MILNKLEINNFWSFVGKNQIKFARNEHSSITIINGVNGSGKSTITNALLWGFTGELKNKATKKNIISKNLTLKLPCEVYVEVDFFHNDIHYILNRKRIYNLDYPEGEDELTLNKFDKTNQYVKVEFPTLELKKIVPVELIKFLFFFGEDINNLVEEKGSMKDAIELMLGIEGIYKLLIGLDGAKNIFLSSSKKKEKKNKVYQNDIESLENIVKSLKKIDSDKLMLEKKLSMHKNFSIKFLDKMKIHKLTEEFSTKIIYLDEKIKEKEKQRDEILEKIKKSVSENGYLVFLYKELEIIKDKLNESRKRGVLPSGIREQYIDDLIQKGVCICGKVFSKDSEEFKSLLELRNKSTSTSLEESYNYLYSKMPLLINQYNVFIKEFTENISLRGNLENDISRIKNNKTEIQLKINEIAIKEDNLEEIAEQYGQHEKEIQEINQKLNSINTEQNELRLLEKELKYSLKNVSSISSSAKLEKQKSDYCENLTMKLEVFKNNLLKQLTVDLSKTITDNYNSYMVEKKSVRISNNYELELYDFIEQTNAISQKKSASTGQVCIASIFFITELLRYIKNSELKYIGKKNYCLVLDSPFGNLDISNQKGISDFINDVSENISQLIILVSDSQFKELRNHIKGNIGKHYILNYHTNAAQNIFYDEYNSSYLLTSKTDRNYIYTSIHEVKENYNAKIN